MSSQLAKNLDHDPEESNKKTDVSTSVNYELMESDRAERLRAGIDARLKAEAETAVKGYSLQKLVLKSVVIGDYDKAKENINHYVTYKSEYPSYERRVKKYVAHCRDLIDAIRVKRNFPNLGALSMAKQKEIMDHVVAHFDELRKNLKLMEKIAGEIMLADVRSTAWLVRTVSYMAILILVAFFMVGFEKEVGVPVWIHFNVMFDEGFDKVWRMLVR